MKETKPNRVEPSKFAFINKLKQKFPTKLGAAIFALIVLHFISQFVFFRNEKEPLKTESVSSQTAEIKYEAKTPDVEKMPDASLPQIVEIKSAPRVSKIAQKEKLSVETPSRVKPEIKKKEFRETRAERLRRAERILTGV